MKNEEKKYKWKDSEKQLVLMAILFDLKKDLLKAERQESFYQAEYAKPTHVGKGVALERLGIYQSQARKLTQEICSLYEYAKENDILVE